MQTSLIIDILGWIAVISNLIGYYLLSNKIIKGFGWYFQILVFVGNFSFIIVNFYRETYSFVLMNAVYLAINFITFYKLYQEQSNLKN